MSSQDLYVNFFIDCESTQPAVNNPAMGDRSAQGYAEILERHGFKGTFFLLPSEAKASASLYLNLKKRGHEIGLHIHPAALGEFEEFLGVYGAEEQELILRKATDQFAQAMGFSPTGICIGYASTNDHTYGVLHQLGYRHGMCSIPTRVLPECASVHAGAPLDIHYANRHNRLLVGDLDFVNIPVTVDPDSRLWGGKHPLDLRVELVDAKNHFYTLDKALNRQIREALPLKCLQGFSHNVFEFGTPGDFRRETLEGILSHICRLAGKYQLRIVPATNAETAAAYRARIPLGSTLKRKSLDRSGYVKG